MRVTNEAENGWWDAGRQALWDNTVQRALDGKRGQRALRLLRDALEAMPERTLIQGTFISHGQVCALGAAHVYAEMVKHDRTWGEALAVVRSRVYGGPCAVCEESAALCDCLEQTDEDLGVDRVQMGEALDMAWAMAWTIVWETDNASCSSGEALWGRMHNWVTARIHEPARVRP